MKVLILVDRPFEVVLGRGSEVVRRHGEMFDARQKFKKGIIQAIDGFMQRAPSAEIRNRREDSNWDSGLASKMTLTSVVLATCLEEINVSYKVWDMDNLILSAGQEVAADLQKNPSIIAVSSTYHTSEEEFSGLIQFIRRYNRKAILIVGGKLLDSSPRIEDLITEADYLVYGDAENVFPLLVSTVLAAGGHIPVDLPGVRYRKDNCYVGKREWEPVDINRTPIPCWDLVLKRSFNGNLADNSPFLPIVYIEEVRGCIHKCAFCSYPNRETSRLKSAKRILAEIKQNIKWGFKHFEFRGALFTCPDQRCRDILDGIIRDRLDISFACQARADDLYRNPGLVKLMKRAGCVHISMGIESGDPGQLRRMRKMLDVRRIPDTVAAIHAAGISLTGNFFIGFPGECEASIKATYELLKKSNLYGLFLNPFVVDRGSEVFRNREKYGLKVSSDGRRWRHQTMNSEEATEQTKRLFVKIANNQKLRTVLYMIQWRFARFFPNLVLYAERPEFRNVLRIIQKGVANELELTLDQISTSELKTMQKQLWEKVMSYSMLFRKGQRIHG